jgi:hypothetical protein
MHLAGLKLMELCDTRPSGTTVCGLKVLMHLAGLKLIELCDTLCTAWSYSSATKASGGKLRMRLAHSKRTAGQPRRYAALAKSCGLKSCLCMRP